MNIMDHICIISNRYPSYLTPTRHVFVQKLVWGLTDLGVKCTVISPVPVNQYITSFKKQPYKVTEKTLNGNSVDIFFPKYISFGQKKIGGYGTSRLTTKTFYDAVLSVISKEAIIPDVFYGHFFVPAGITAALLGKKYKKPSFVAYGEASPRDLLLFGKERLKKAISELKGVIAVSTANKDILVNNGFVDHNMIDVFPNAVLESRFYSKNRIEARTKFGFDPNVFIISFVGQFIERKGIVRLGEAVKGLDDVKVIYGGSGPLSPLPENCLYSGPISPLDMPDFLNASDVFVLPTLNEGCCNSIVEAVSCGLPVISSDLPFNYDILGTDNAMLIDPLDVNALRNAIIKMKDNNDLRMKLGLNSLKRATKLTVSSRAQNIKNWIESHV